MSTRTAHYALLGGYAALMLTISAWSFMAAAFLVLPLAVAGFLIDIWQSAREQDE